MKPTISVIMPAYNQDEIFINQAVESVLSQTYKDFELIIVDDGSTEESYKIIGKFKSEFKIKIIRHKTNMGIGAARNTGIKSSSGKYVAFLSSDDIWKKDFLEKMMANLKEGIIFCNYDVILKNGGRVRTEKVMPEDEICTYSKQNFEKLVKITAKQETLFVNYSCILGERIYFEEKNAFNDDLKFGEDLHHIVRISNKAIFTYLPESLTFYRWHDNNTTNKVTHLMAQNNQKIFKLLREEGIDI